MQEQEKSPQQDAYEAPRLEVVDLHGEELLAKSCKDITGAGPTLTCQDQFGVTCSSLGS